MVGQSKNRNLEPENLDSNPSLATRIVRSGEVNISGPQFLICKKGVTVVPHRVGVRIH